MLDGQVGETATLKRGVIRDQVGEVIRAQDVQGFVSWVRKLDLI